MMSEVDEIEQHLRELIMRGELAQAEGVLNEALRGRDGAEVGRHWEMLGIAAYAHQRLPLARNALETASAYVPLTIHGQVLLAACYVASNFPESARAILIHVAGRSDLPTELLELTASSLGRIRENELALAVCREAANRSPDSPEPFMGMAYYMRRLRRPTEQIICVLFRAHCLAPESRTCRIQLAWLLHESGQSEEGAYLLERLPIEHFDCVCCVMLMQAVFEAASDTTRAIKCRRRLEEIAGERSIGR